MRAIIIPSLVTAFSMPFPVFAATVEARVLVSVGMGGVGAPPEMFDARDEVVGPVETLLISDSVPAAASGYFGSGAASAQYAVNGYTGEIRVGMNANVTATSDGERGGAAAYSLVSLTQAFRVVGSGIMTVGMAVSAEWASPNFGFDACITYNGTTYGTPGISFKSDCLSREVLVDGTMGLIDREFLEISFDVPEDTDGFVDFTWMMQGNVGVGGGYGPSESGFLDAMNTAEIYLRTFGDVTATALTAGFLSDPAFSQPEDPAPVPLPASALMLIAGLGGLAALRRKAAVS